MQAFGGFAGEDVLLESGLRRAGALAVKVWSVAGGEFGFGGAEGGMGVG